MTPGSLRYLVTRTLSALSDYVASVRFGPWWLCWGTVGFPEPLFELFGCCDFDFGTNIVISVILFFHIFLIVNFSLLTTSSVNFRCLVAFCNTSDMPIFICGFWFTLVEVQRVGGNKECEDTPYSYSGFHDYDVRTC